MHPQVDTRAFDTRKRGKSSKRADKIISRVMIICIDTVYICPFNRWSSLKPLLTDDASDYDWRGRSGQTLHGEMYVW